MSDALKAVQSWVDEVVVGLALCPFATRPLVNDRVRWVSTEATANELPELFVDELQRLVEASPVEIATTLIVLEDRDVGRDFERFLDVAFTCEAILDESGADALVQLATFHPDYRFAGETDPAVNATHRAPHPVLHLLRVEQVEEAIARHGDIPGLLERNRDVMRRRLGSSSSD